MNDKFVFFWGGIYSNWFPCNLLISGAHYNCVEQYMMAQKALAFDDMQAYNDVMATPDPSKQKAIGRKVIGFDPKAWNAISKDVVYEACWVKFQDANLKAQLLATGDKELVEASPYDTIWGIGMGENDPDRFDKTKWRGTNWLGVVLMEVRKNLK
jgi:ribA/ribD-fused uncharacterized protein